MLKIGIVAGEPSGDHLGADLIRRLRQVEPDLEISGVGGPALKAEGCDSLYPMHRLSVMGIVEVARHFFDLVRIRGELKRHFLRERPDIFIGIDSPDFNLPLERYLREQGIRTIHYVSPSVWAWREGRLRTIASSVDLMLTLFPFEKQYYDDRGIPALCTGHPLAREIPEQNDCPAARAELGLDPGDTCVAVLPGSRRAEIRRISPAFLDACTQIQAKKPGVRFLAGFHDHASEQLFQQVRLTNGPGVPVQTFVGKTRSVMAAADVILVASGTATLEAMLVKRPMVVGYRVNPVTALLIRWMLKVPFVSLPNLLSNEGIIPEHLQGDCEGGNLARSVLKWLEDEAACRDLMEKYHGLHRQLLQADSNTAADRIIALGKR